MQEFHFRQMNTDIQLLAQGAQDTVTAGFDQVRQFMEDSEKRFSRFLPESELSRMNASAGKPFHVSRDMYTVMQLAERYFHLSRGLFDPSILPDLRRAGYNVSFEKIGVNQEVLLPMETQPDGRPSFSEIEMNEAQNLILLPPGMNVDLGGIAKGWIAEQSALLLAGYAEACAVNAGGDMFLVGNPEGRGTWPVSIENPLHPETTLTTLQVGPGAVVTSSIARRKWKQGGRDRHHLIDPRTGEPAQADWLSVTVIAEHASDAEVFAKSLLIGGLPVSEYFLRPGGNAMIFIAVDRNLKLWSSHPFPELEYVQ